MIQIAEALLFLTEWLMQVEHLLAILQYSPVMLATTSVGATPPSALQLDGHILQLVLSRVSIQYH